MKRTGKLLLLIFLIAIVLGGLMYLWVSVTRPRDFGWSELTTVLVKNEEEEPDTDNDGVPDQEEPLPYKGGVIYIGDSRFVGMNEALGVDNGVNHFVVAEVGQGYRWMVNEALYQAQQIEDSHPELTDWRYVICLGINDLVNLSEYIEKYRELSATKSLMLVSVGPVDNYPDIQNTDVEAFNQSILESTKSMGIPYIDYYSVLQSEGFEAPDHLHYSDETYGRIYEILSTVAEVQ